MKCVFERKVLDLHDLGSPGKETFLSEAVAVMLLPCIDCILSNLKIQQKQQHAEGSWLRS